jgi:serine/threonine protein kinase
VLHYSVRGKYEGKVRGKYEGPPVGSDKEILFQIARGTEYLTEKGLVNRNINPDTILISLPDGNIPPKIKLVDFIFSRKLDKDVRALAMSEVYKKCGLNEWCASELWREETSTAAAKHTFIPGGRHFCKSVQSVKKNMASWAKGW